MPSYLVESYLARARAGELPTTTSLARRAAAAMRAEGISVRYLRSTFLAEDEVCLHFFDAPSVEAAGEVSRRAAIEYDRITEAIE
jgi:hypothetical protein